METTILIALTGLMLTAIALIGGLMYRLGRLSARVDRLYEESARDRQESREDAQQMRQEAREDAQQLREEAQQFRQEMREEAQQFRQEMREEAQQLRQEMRDGFQQMRDEMRRGNQQLLLALANHTHDPASGAALFRVPYVTE